MTLTSFVARRATKRSHCRFKLIFYCIRQIVHTLFPDLFCEKEITRYNQEIPFGIYFA